MVKIFDPTTRQASSVDIAATELFEDEWTCELVEPRHPALTQRANMDPFSIDNHAEIWQDRQERMLDLMHRKMGIGLSSNQIGSAFNMFVMHHSILGGIGIYKPEILEESQEQVAMEEGCLTWPLLYLSVTRPAAVRVRYYKSDGETQVETWMDGMDARCFLHEYQHLQGSTFLDGQSDYKLRRARAKRDKLFKRAHRQVKRQFR